MQYLLLAALVVCYTAQSVYSLIFARSYAGEIKNAAWVYNVLSCTGVALANLGIVLYFGKTPALPITLWLGLANGISFTLFNLCNVLAAVKGPYSVVSAFFICGGVILPILESVLIFNYRLSVPQTVFIILLVVLLIMMSVCKYHDEAVENKQSKRDKLIFYICCAAMFITNGAYGAIIASHKKLVAGSPAAFRESMMLIFITYAVTAVLSMICLFGVNKKFAVFGAFRLNRKSTEAVIVSVITLIGGIIINIRLLGIIDEALVSPVSCGGSLVLTSFLSILLYKEKVSVKSVLTLLGITVCVVILGFME